MFISRESDVSTLEQVTEDLGRSSKMKGAPKMRRSLLTIFMLLLVFVFSCASALGSYNDSQTGWNGSQDARWDLSYASTSHAIQMLNGSVVVNGSSDDWSAYGVNGTYVLTSDMIDGSLMLVIYNVAGNSSSWSPVAIFTGTGTYSTTRILTSTSGTAYDKCFAKNVYHDWTATVNPRIAHRYSLAADGFVWQQRTVGVDRTIYSAVALYTSSGINPDRYAPDQKCAIYSADGMNTSNSQILLYLNPQPEMGINLASVNTKVSTGTATVQINDESVGKYTTDIVISEANTGGKIQMTATKMPGGNSGMFARNAIPPVSAMVTDRTIVDGPGINCVDISHDLTSGNAMALDGATGEWTNGEDLSMSEAYGLQVRSFERSNSAAMFDRTNNRDDPYRMYVETPTKVASGIYFNSDSRLMAEVVVTNVTQFWAVRSDVVMNDMSTTTTGHMFI